MRVTHKKVVKFFIEHGFIATLRNFPYVAGQKVIVNMPHKKNRGRVILVFENWKREDLEKFVCISGFDSVDEWLETAVRLHGNVPKRLVVVVRRGTDPRFAWKYIEEKGGISYGQKAI